MKNVRNISKKIITLFLIICMVSIYFPSLTLISFATDNNISSLDTPMNLNWKNNSTATISWNTVTNANYYTVNLYLYNNSDELLNSRETGTSSNELDIQQEINFMMNEKNIELKSFKISFDVMAVYLSENETVMSAKSDESAKKQFEIGTGTIKLNAPTNVNIDNDYNATWTASTGADHYVVTFIINGNERTSYGECVFTNYSSNYSYGTTSNGIFRANIRKAIEDYYNKMIKYGYVQSGQAVELKFNVKANPSSINSSTYIESDKSEYSSVFNYSGLTINKLATPTNISIDDDYNATWTASTGADHYVVTFIINGNERTSYGECVFTNYSSNYSYGTTSNGIFRANIRKAIEDYYNKMIKYGYVQSGKTVELKFNVKANPSSINSSTYIESDISEYSNVIYYNSDGTTKINDITLSPSKPVIAVGRTLYIGKTINPENAIYDKIIWSTSDNSIVTINNVGQITGVKKGNATITAKINNTTQDADVSVYEIESNINNTEQATAVINEANDVIEAITKNEDISNTDIIDKQYVLNEVEQGAQNGDMFNVDIKYDEKSATEYNGIKDIIDSRYEEYNIAGGSDIKIAISHTDNKGTEHHIVNITELESEINVEFDIPSNIPKLDKTKKRDYKLVRLHNENVEDIDFEISNGKIETSSDKFSDFVLLYKDTELPTFNLSGAITSYNSETDDIAIQLYKANEIEIFEEKSVKGNNTNYSFENVPAGEYIVRVSKNNHVTREYNITLDNSDIILDTKICLIGDINEDGKVNGKDWNRLYEHINETNEITDYELLCADVNKDEKVNGKDWNRLYEHITEVNPLF